jgi:integrase
VATDIDFKLHDLRRVWATIAVEKLDVPPHIADAVLAHTVGNSVSRTYNRALYIQPMREALLKFEAYIASIC